MMMSMSGGFIEVEPEWAALDYRSHAFVFVGGLHKSGTSILHEGVRQHPEISGFKDTGVHQDEGQLLQSIYPPAARHGGWGRFGFDPRAHLTETSSLVSAGSRDRLIADWARYWDPTKPFLVEKSPPNIIRTRFLQAMFPNSYFVMIMRHPISVSLASLKWAKHPARRIVKGRTTGRLIKHWIHCHKVLAGDALQLQRLKVIKYEKFVADPMATLASIFSFIGATPFQPELAIRAADNEDKYFSKWRSLASSPVQGLYVRRVATRFEKGVLDFGYSLQDLTIADDWTP
jgi:hypothetical protein